MLVHFQVSDKMNRHIFQTPRILNNWLSIFCPWITFLYDQTFLKNLSFIVEKYNYHEISLFLSVQFSALTILCIRNIVQPSLLSIFKTLHYSKHKICLHYTLAPYFSFLSASSNNCATFGLYESALARYLMKNHTICKIMQTWYSLLICVWLIHSARCF